MRYFIKFTYLLAAAINLAPAIGVYSNDILGLLYGVEIPSSELSLLLRHRAVLFALVGGLLLTAAFQSHLRTQAGIAGLISMLSFVVLFIVTGADNESLLRVALIDSVVGSLFIAGFGLHLLKRGSA
ncbi:MAG: phosphopantetheine adenylyltransferase [SAR86 cluster bacterium]|uniref:Phosphopantetheine adenylyltransferase n=1 Tax=SAR86 cluster bacterium TaxID=2030880 RepID=A0A2A4WZ04_9GAMM|nr:MAG: phosphopantetheine adenylyltransferase [SAR86 cluster bacterium]